MMHLLDESRIEKLALREIRSYAIRHAGGQYVYKAAPIEHVDGMTKPHFVGESYSFQTKTGKPVRHPNAYRRAWGKPVYIASTRRIIVGRDWIKQLKVDIAKLLIM